MRKNALALSMLVGCAMSMQGAQRQVIDTHAHLALSEAAVKRAVQIMDENGIVTMVDLSGGFGEQLKSKAALYKRIAPGRFAVFANMDFSKVNDPQFPKKAMADLEEAYRLGARGLKSFKSLGLTHKDQNGRLIRFDDPRFDPVISPRLDLVWKTGEATRWKLLLGSAYRAPSVYETDYTAQGQIGNAALRPERVRSAEGSFVHYRGPLGVTLSAYANHVRDLIDLRFGFAGNSLVSGCGPS